MGSGAYAGPEGARRGPAGAPGARRSPPPRMGTTGFGNAGPGQPDRPNSRAISMRWTSLVPSPISRIFESRHIRATGYSFMKP